MPDEIFTLVGGRKIHYRLDKCPHPVDKPSKLVILSNSLAAPFTSWDNVVSHFIELGFDVLRYNQPGHGQSGVPARLGPLGIEAVPGATTFETLATDVHMLLHHRLQIPKVHAWVGVSMGAATGVYFTGMYPGVVDRLVVADTISCSAAAAGTPEKDVFGPRVAAARKDGGMQKLIDGTLERWFGHITLSAPPHVNLAFISHEIKRMRTLMNAGVTIDGFETCCAALRDRDFDLRGRRAQAAGRGVQRALLIVGEKDANLPETMKELRDDIQKGMKPEETEKKVGSGVIELSDGQVPQVELKVITDAGHVCYIDGLAQFEHIVGQFLTAE